MERTLVEKLELCRSKRHSEWKMDELINDAKELELSLIKEKESGICLGIGWMYAESCILAEKGKDICKEEVPKLLSRALIDITI